MAASAQLRVLLNLFEEGTNVASPQIFNPGPSFSRSLIEGSAGAGFVNRTFYEQRTVASASNDDLDLAAGLTRPFGGTLTLGILCGLFVINAPVDPNATQNTTSLTIGGGTNYVTGFQNAGRPIPPGGCQLIFCGEAGGLAAITAATADIIRIANGSGAAATYQIALWGRTGAS